MTMTEIRPATRHPRELTPAERAAELTAMLSDPRYAGWTAELQAARAELVELTATTVLAA